MIPLVFLISIVTLFFYNIYLKPKKELKIGDEVSRYKLNSVEIFTAMIPLFGIFWFKWPHKVLRELQEKYLLDLHGKYIKNAIQYAKNGEYEFVLVEIKKIFKNIPGVVFEDQSDILFVIRTLLECYQKELFRLDLLLKKERFTQSALEEGSFDNTVYCDDLLSFRRLSSEQIALLESQMDEASELIQKIEELKTTVSSITQEASLNYLNGLIN